METRTVTLNVTKDDIKNGKRGDGNFCPIALALKREFPNAIKMSVGTWLIVRSPGSICEARPSVQAVLFMRDFDKGRRFFSRAKPFTEEVTFDCVTTIPGPRKQGDQQEEKPGDEEGPTS